MKAPTRMVGPGSGPAASTAATVSAVLDAAGADVPGLLAAVEGRLSEIARETGAPLADHALATVRAGGKRLRPLLVLVAAGGPVTPEREAGLLRAAVAVELVHSATLVHDDILDAADLRRGRPTIVAVAGRGAAIATGDALFARAFSELAVGGRPGAIRLLSDASGALARGELLQREDAWRADLGLARYLERCELKTARLFEAACRLGALQGDGPADDLGAFGRRIGLAFQLFDDVLDVSGPATRTGKHRGTDLLDGTVTLPLILARERDRALAALDLRSVRSVEAAEALCERISDTGALVAARARGLDIVAEAKRQLPRLGAGQRRALELVADGVVDRPG